MLFDAKRTSNFTDRIKKKSVTEINVLCWCNKIITLFNLLLCLLPKH
jgi:hypothetical protein